MPSIQFIEAYLSVMTYKENNENFGLFIEMSIFDEYFDSITFNVVKQPYIMVQLQYFDNFTDNVKWRNTLVRYSIKYEENASYYSYAMTFTIGHYNYFINFDSFSEMSVTEALDIIYRVDVKGMRKTPTSIYFRLKCSRISPTRWRSTPTRRYRVKWMNGWTDSTPFRYIKSCRN